MPRCAEKRERRVGAKDRNIDEREEVAPLIAHIPLIVHI